MAKASAEEKRQRARRMENNPTLLVYCYLIACSSAFSSLTLMTNASQTDGRSITLRRFGTLISNSPHRHGTISKNKRQIIVGSSLLSLQDTTTDALTSIRGGGRSPSSSIISSLFVHPAGGVHNVSGWTSTGSPALTSKTVLSGKASSSDDPSSLDDPSSSKATTSTTSSSTASPTSSDDGSTTSAQSQSHERFPTSLVEEATNMKSIAEHNTIVDDATGEDLLTYERETTTNAPLKILFLSSDTGGGHRASAESLAKQFLRHFPGSSYDLLDIWTADGVYPYKTLVESYKYLSRHPNHWRFLYHISNSRPYEWCTDKHSTFMCAEKIRQRIASYKPDVVVSVHPAMNYAPMKAVKKLSKELGKHIPFFTVVTDYGSAHCTWFQRNVEKIYVASERIRKLAKRRGQGIPDENIVMAGLPIRADFATQANNMGDRTTEKGKRYQQQVRHELGVDPHTKTILVMGGGEGVGSLAEIVNELYCSLTKRGVDAEVLVVCGRNEKLLNELRTRDWDSVLKQADRLKKRHRGLNFLRRLTPSRRVRRKIHTYLERKRGGPEEAQGPAGKVKVDGLGFINNMAEYMVAADVLVTKAGPGSIAEAAAVGLPVMLTSFLPGQEAGNVDIVLDGEFGAYCRNPKSIGEEVTLWLEDAEMLGEMSRNAMKEGAPHAASDIVMDIGEITERWMELNQKHERELMQNQQ
jgi:1,2-diacylglycerol 3-beta-galactosyltransferase